jgi:hypothetical protein
LWSKQINTGTNFIIFLIGKRHKKGFPEAELPFMAGHCCLSMPSDFNKFTFSLVPHQPFKQGSMVALTWGCIRNTWSPARECCQSEVESLSGRHNPRSYSQPSLITPCDNLVLSPSALELSPPGYQHPTMLYGHDTFVISYPDTIWPPNTWDRAPCPLRDRRNTGS